MEIFNHVLFYKNRSLFLVICALWFYFPALLAANNISSDSTLFPLFADDDIITITLSGPLRSLFKDRTGEPTYKPMILSYYATDSTKVILPLQAKTRGHFRRISTNCTMPPLLLNFDSNNIPANSIFKGQDKLKLVTPCRDDKYVVREYLVYKLCNLVSDHSFKARLVRVIYEDLEKGKRTQPLYGIILEDEDEMASRYGMKIDKTDLISPKHVAPAVFIKMAVFQYLIGNTDWSIQYRQNIKLLRADLADKPIPVPYDFDHAGLVDAPYAKPAPELQLNSVKERLYRGYCLQKIEAFKRVFEHYENNRDKIYICISTSPYLDEKYKKVTLKFIDKFYHVIRDPKASSKAFLYPCDPHGTGNIVIKGLRN